MRAHKLGGRVYSVIPLAMSRIVQTPLPSFVRTSARGVQAWLYRRLNQLSMPEGPWRRSMAHIVERHLGARHPLTFFDALAHAPVEV